MDARFSAQEISDLVGVPKRTVHRWAQEEQWHGSRDIVNGAAVTRYPLSLLPTERQVMLLGPEAQAPAIAGQPAGPTLATLKDWQREVLHARVVLFRYFQKLEAQLGTGPAIDEVVSMADAGALPNGLQQYVPIANARCRGNSRTISRATIFRWKKMSKGGLVAFAPKDAEQPAVPPWAPYFIACYNTPDKPSVTQAMERMAAKLPPEIAMPSYSQVSRFHRKRSRIDRERGRRTGSELKSMQGYRRRDTSELRPMDVGVCDGHSFKARVAHPVHGKPFKPEICSVIDAATRVLVGWSVGLAESATTVAGAIRHAATVNDEKPFGGVFSVLYTDCGSGNMAKVNTDELTGVFDRIGTTHTKGIPGNAQGRGLIERLNSSLWIPAAKELPTFVGQEMDSLTQRSVYLLVNKEIKQSGRSARLATWPQFIDHCRRSADAYNRRPHSALPKIDDPQTGRRRHMCPLEMWAWHVSRGWEQSACLLSDQEIEVLFLPRRECTVDRAQVRLFTNVYYNKVLEHYDGQKVQVGYDIHDASRVQIWDGDGRLVCYAHFDKNKTSYFPKSFVEQAADQRAKRRAQIKLDQLAEIEAERRGVIEATPGRVIELTPVAPALKADRKALVAEMSARTEEIAIPTDDKGKFRYWNELHRRMNSGETLSEREVQFYEAYRKSASFRAFSSVSETLGGMRSALRN